MCCFLHMQLKFHRAEHYPGQSCHTDGSSHVVSEVEEGRTVGDHARVVQGNAVGNCSHAVLTHTIPQVLLLVLALLEVAVHLHQGHVGGSQVCRPQIYSVRKMVLGQLCLLLHRQNYSSNFAAVKHSKRVNRPYLSRGSSMNNTSAAFVCAGHKVMRVSVSDALRVFSDASNLGHT